MPIGDENPLPYRPFVNTAIVIANIIVFAVGWMKPQLLLPGAKSYSDVIVNLGMTPYKIIHGEALYTLFTSMFIHADLLHLLGNMFFLYVFGDNIEAAMGRLRYLVFYFISGLGATCFHILSLALTPGSTILSTYSINPWFIQYI